MEEERALPIVQRRLLPGERLIWWGRPKPLCEAVGPLYGLVFLTIWMTVALYIWVVLALFCLAPVVGISMRLAPGSCDPRVGFIITAVMVVFGGFMWRLCLREVLDCWKRAYGLTDRRIIIAAGETGRTQSFTAKTVSDVSWKGGKTGSVTIDYKINDEICHAYLVGIAEPERVGSLIRDTLIAPQQQEPI